MARLQGASAYSGEKSPPGICPKTKKPVIMSSRASRKLGTLRPRKLSPVKKWSPKVYWRTAE